MVLNFWAQPGMLSAGVNIPLISTNIIRMKNITNRYCCWVEDIAEKKRVRPRTAIRYSEAYAKSSNREPSKGILKNILPSRRPKARSIIPIIRKGTSLATIN